MTHIKTRVTTFLVTLILLFIISAPASATSSKLNIAVTESASYLLDTVKAPKVSTVGGEWTVLGLARSGYDVPQSYWDNYYSYVENHLVNCNGVLHNKKYTEYSRVIVALTAIGADPTNVAGYNLLKPLGDFERTIYQGINGPVWALIALDCGNYEIPLNSEAKTQATKQMYIDEIISHQLSDGGWSLNGKGDGTTPSDPDITGMVLQALARYQTQDKVKSAIDKALICLSTKQDATGGYTSSWGDKSSESVVQVIVALCELQVDLNDSRFIKNGNTLMDNLMSYRQRDGSFAHTGSESNIMATEQGFYGMVSAKRATESRNSLYNMSDATIRISDNCENSNGLPNKNTNVKKCPIVHSDRTFTDICNQNQTAIESLAARGIINGRGNGKFSPNDNMTRAEFATIVVRALGLTPKSTKKFSDVNMNSWYANYVGTASTYGITNGIGNGCFAPGHTITRQEATVMVARAAKLCGMDTSMDNILVLDTLAQFGDYVTVAKWAREGVAFCYSSNILDQSDIDVIPLRPVLRCEIAQMLYNMLSSSKLL